MYERFKVKKNEVEKVIKDIERLHPSKKVYFRGKNGKFRIAAGYNWLTVDDTDTEKPLYLSSFYIIEGLYKNE